MTTCCGHSEDADGAMASDLPGAEPGTRALNEPEPRKGYFVTVRVPRKVGMQARATLEIPAIAGGFRVSGP